jgi:hypothetical protein
MSMANYGGGKQKETSIGGANLYPHKRLCACNAQGILRDEDGDISCLSCGLPKVPPTMPKADFTLLKGVLDG